MDKKLNELLDKAKNVKLSPEQKEEQRRSFAYGNTNIENARIIRETVDREAEKLAAPAKLTVEEFERFSCQANSPARTVHDYKKEMVRLINERLATAREEPPALIVNSCGPKRPALQISCYVCGKKIENKFHLVSQRVETDRPFVVHCKCVSRLLRRAWVHGGPTVMKHTRATCNGKCGQPYGCNLYNLFLCSVCGGAEGSLPTDCPGVKMSADQEEKVYGGSLDYREDKGWCEPDGTGDSMGDADIRMRLGRDR